MRKWTYLVAALLMSGATATFTSCIDTEETEEPAGIEQLRGAKAALIQAKADYQAQLTAYREVQVRMAEVDLQLKEVTLQIEQLKVAQQQALSDYEVARIQNEIEKLAEEQKADLAELKAETARQEAALEQALTDLELVLLTYKETEYQNSIQTAIWQVQMMRRTLAASEESLRGYQAQLINVKAGLGDSYRAGLVADSLGYEKILENQRFSLEQVQALADVNHTDVSEQVTAIDQQISDIKAQALDITNEIATITEAINPVTTEIAEIETEYAVQDKNVEIPVAKVPAAIQEDFLDVLQSTSVTGTSLNWWELAASTFYNEDWTEMTADFVATTSLKNSFENTWGRNLDVYIDDLIEAFQDKYAAEFWSTYNTEFGTSYSTLAPYSEITSEVIAMAKTKLAELDKDAAKAYDVFKADSTAWADAYKAYKAAADAYGYQYNPYADTQAKLETYWGESDATKKAAALTAARAALVSYYAVRVSLDNPSLPQVTPTGATAAVSLDVALGNATTYTDAMLGTLLDGNTYSTTYFLGSDIDLTDKTTSVSLSGDATDDGALQAYVRASQKVWGTGLTLGAARVTAATEEEYENGSVRGGTWGTYMGIAAGYEIFANIESWLALEEVLVEQSDKYQAAIDDIEVRVAEKEASIAEQQDKIYKLEFDRYALDGTRNFTSGNPYISGIASVISKVSSLETLRGAIITNSTATANYTVYIYVKDPITDTYKWDDVSGDKETLISSLETSINTVQQALDSKKAEIERFDAGLEEGSYSTTIANLVQQIANMEQQIEEDKANLARAEGLLNNLLESYAASAE